MNEKPFGWEVTVELRQANGSKEETIGYRGCTRRRAELRANLRKNVSRVVAVQPIEREAFIRFYGIGRM